MSKPAASIQIVSGSSNVTFTSPNKFTFTLPSVYSSGSKDQIALKDLRMYYSFFNISAAKGNNTFSYVWVNGSTYTVTLPDGIWAYSDVNDLLQQTMEANGHYLINGNGAKIYYLSLTENGVLYKISVTCSPVPTSLPAGWSQPSNWPGYQGTLKVPLFVVPATNIQSYFGFPAGSYPSVTQTTAYYVNSPNVPQVTSSSSLLLTCNLTNNAYSAHSRVLTSFNVTPGAAPGSLLTVAPPFLDWFPVQPGQRFSTIEIELLDQLLRPVKIEDPAGMILTLNLRSE